MDAVYDPLIPYDELPPSIRKARHRLNEEIAAGKFPAPVQISPNRIGWRRSEIENHISNLPVVEPKAPRRHTATTREKMRIAWEIRRRRGRERRQHAAGD
jgi:predicted DNA-binding transcriptional regulator AlpA